MVSMSALNRPGAPRSSSRGTPRTDPRGTRRADARGTRRVETGSTRKVSGRSATSVSGGGGAPASAAATLSWRAVVLTVVVVLALAVLLPSLRAYVRQQDQLAELRAQVGDASAEVAELEAEVARWGDPAYVVAQARERLSYVFPGERPFRVIDPEFVAPLDPATGAPALPGDDAPIDPWYQTLWGSFEAAGTTDA